MDYLPKCATIEQACDWLQARTGQKWILARLLECGLTPWFWLDYKPGYPAIFGDKVEGYLAPMVFASDTQRLEADGTDALVNITRAHDGTIFKIEPGMRVPLSELKFRREDIERVATVFNGDSLPATAPKFDAGIDIPGKLPRIAVGKLAVQAAWEIECRSKRAANDREVMAHLQQWADSGAKPDVLKKSNKEKRGVVWLTRRYEDKFYTLEACQKTLQSWNESRERTENLRE